MATKKNSAKSATKKSTVKPAAKKAAPVKKVAAKKVTPVKKAAAKATPTKKVVPVKKGAAKKVTTKKIEVKKVAPAKKAAPKKVEVKKATPTKKEAVKKIIAPKKVATKKATPTPTKKVETAKKAVVKNTEKPATVTKAKDTQKADVKEATAVKANTPPPRRSKKHDIPIIPVLPARSEFADAVRQKPKSNVNKPGVVIAQRRINKKDKKEDTQDTMKEYNPTKRSLLDKIEQSTGPVFRYSDDELNEFKDLIIKRLDNAKKELSFLQGLITRKDEAGTEDTDNRFNHMEDGSGAMEREQLSQLAGRQIQFINNLEKALVRIENKTYGICRETGKLIDKARLKAVPHATLSIEAKNARR